VQRRDDLIRAYNEVAREYAVSFRDELEHKPFDRELFERFVAELPGGSRVCDLGCGPGHVAEHLRSLGADAFGVDIAGRMALVGGQLFPSVDFVVGDMLALGLREGVLGGIVALYSIIHVAPRRLPEIFGEMFRVLIGGGGLILSCHRGEGELLAENWFDKGISFHCYLHGQEELVERLEEAGFSMVEEHLRAPYPSEHPSERVYIWARKPSQGADGPEDVSRR
jgi:SAM-dependent methyltransferase